MSEKLSLIEVSTFLNPIFAKSLTSSSVCNMRTSWLPFEDFASTASSKYLLLGLVDPQDLLRIPSEMRTSLQVS